MARTGSNLKTMEKNVAIKSKKADHHNGNYSLSVANMTEKLSDVAQKKASLRSVITSKYADYNGYNLHDDLAFDWHPGTSGVYLGDQGDYHGQGGYEPYIQGGYDMNHAHGDQNGDYYVGNHHHGGVGHNEGEHHNDHYHQ